MNVFTLQTLVLRGVSVVCDGHNVGLRLGAESRTVGTSPEVRVHPRRPSHNAERGFTPAQRPDDHAEYDRMAAAAALGAGRSLRCERVHSRSTAISAYSAVALKPVWRKPAGKKLLASTWAS
jgi:hypothetical protein